MKDLEVEYLPRTIIDKLKGRYRCKLIYKGIRIKGIYDTREIMRLPLEDLIHIEIDKIPGVDIEVFRKKLNKIQELIRSGRDNFSWPGTCEPCDVFLEGKQVPGEFYVIGRKLYKNKIQITKRDQLTESDV